MTIAEALRRATTYLRENGSPSARLDAEVLLAHCLGRRRVDLYTRREEPLGEPEEQAYRVLLERRAAGEPVSYLTGRKEFFGLTFLVDRRVLIPRPETEVLVERALDCARALGRPALRIADIGTGSGCIAIALACHLPAARIYATDLSAEALELAVENARRYGVAEQVRFLQGDLCAPLPEPVDLLLSNLPYTIWEMLPKGITAYEPRLALDGGADGLALYRRLLPQAARYLRPGGFVLLEVGDGQSEAVRALVRESPDLPVRMWPDYAGVERVLQLGPCPEDFPKKNGMLT